MRIISLTHGSVEFFVCSNFSFSYSRVLTWNSRKSLGKCIKRTEITHRGGRGWAGGGEIEAETFLFSLISFSRGCNFLSVQKEARTPYTKILLLLRLFSSFELRSLAAIEGRAEQMMIWNIQNMSTSGKMAEKLFPAFLLASAAAAGVMYYYQKSSWCWRRTELYISYPSRRKTGEIFSLGFFILSLLFSLYFFYSGFFHPFPIRQSLFSRPLGQPSITQQFHTPK